AGGGSAGGDRVRVSRPALTGAVVTVASRHEGWRVPFAARLVVGLIGAGVAAGCAGVAETLELFPGAHRASRKCSGGRESPARRSSSSCRPGGLALPLRGGEPEQARSP